MQIPIAHAHSMQHPSFSINLAHYFSPRFTRLRGRRVLNELFFPCFCPRPLTRPMTCPMILQRCYNLASSSVFSFFSAFTSLRRSLYRLSHQRSIAETAHRPHSSRQPPQRLDPQPPFFRSLLKDVTRTACIPFFTCF